MANEPDNLVLIQLREIRATQTEHSARFDQIDKHLDEMDKRFEDFHAATSHALMLSTTNSLRQRELEHRHGFSEGEQRRMTECLNELEHRIARIEEDRER